MSKSDKYPSLPGLEKFRKIKHPTPEQRQVHGEAVEIAIRALQASELQCRFLPRGWSSPPIKPRCVSGTWRNDGDKIAQAIRQQHRAALLAYPERVRRRRSAAQWRAMYEQAMREKAEAIEQKASDVSKPIAVTGRSECSVERSEQFQATRCREGDQSRCEHRPADQGHRNHQGRLDQDHDRRARQAEQQRVGQRTEMARIRLKHVNSFIGKDGRVRHYSEARHGICA